MYENAVQPTQTTSDDSELGSELGIELVEASTRADVHAVIRLRK